MEDRANRLTRFIHFCLLTGSLICLLLKYALINVPLHVRLHSLNSVEKLLMRHVKKQSRLFLIVFFFVLQ